MTITMSARLEDVDSIVASMRFELQTGTPERLEIHAAQYRPACLSILSVSYAI